MCGACGTGRSRPPWESFFLETAGDYRQFVTTLNAHLSEKDARARVLVMPGRTFMVKMPTKGTRLASSVGALTAMIHGAAPEAKTPGVLAYDASGFLGTRASTIDFLAILVAHADEVTEPVMITGGGSDAHMKLALAPGSLSTSGDGVATPDPIRMQSFVSTLPIECPQLQEIHE